MNDKYDITQLKNRLKEVRKSRWNQYKKYESTDEKEKYSKFSCCKNQETLASQIGVSRQAIINWEKGNVIPDVYHLTKLCSVLDCSMDYLLGSVDSPEFEASSKAAHYSGISAEIIKYGIEDPDYLDCLNYFMKPERCSDLFNKVTLSAWKKFHINSRLSEIKAPLKELIFRYYDEYNATISFNKFGKSTYKSFLRSKFPREKLILSSKKNQEGIRIKDCFEPTIYKHFCKKNKFNYSLFIEYLAEYTFEPLSYNVFLEIKKAKISNAFIDIFTEYLEKEE